jgi:HAD superfamily hydrolase (TIGR01509 family)
VKIKAAVFDMDGLMFDTERLAMAAWDYAGEKMGLGKAGYMVMKTLGVTAERADEIWREEFGSNVDTKAMRRYGREFTDNFYEHNKVPVKYGLYELLDWLKSSGIKTAVASSSTRRAVLRNLESAGITDKFDIIVSGEMATRSKPAPDIYLKACELLGENPNDCIALEDSRNGLWAAHNAGCRVIMVPDLWKADEETEKILWKKLGSLLEVRDFLRDNEQ